MQEDHEDLKSTGNKMPLPIENSVNHPNHYGGEDNPYEAIKVIEALEFGFNVGNAFKYIARANKKHNNPVEDLEKAVWYLQREINNIKKGNVVGSKQT